MCYPYNMTFAESLKDARRRWQHTQEQAARKVGVTLSTWSKWEQGLFVPKGLYSRETARYIAKARKAKP